MLVCGAVSVRALLVRSVSVVAGRVAVCSRAAACSVGLGVVAEWAAVVCPSVRAVSDERGVAVACVGLSLLLGSAAPERAVVGCVSRSLLAAVEGSLSVRAAAEGAAVCAVARDDSRALVDRLVRAAVVPCSAASPRAAVVLSGARVDLLVDVLVEALAPEAVLAPADRVFTSVFGCPPFTLANEPRLARAEASSRCWYWVAVVWCSFIAARSVAVG